jgi:hypothetical protein
VAIIVISYLFNDTITTAEDVEKKLGLNVLGSVPIEENTEDGDSRKKKQAKGKKKQRRRS